MRGLSPRAHSGLIRGSYGPRVSDESWGFEEGDEFHPGRTAVRLLGGGTRYEAYLAWDDDLRALVVAKLLRPSLVEDARSRAALRREAALLTSLAHPAIVRAFDVSPEAPRPHLLLEHLDGPRLSTLIRRHGVILEQLLPLALELCSALHYLSVRGVAHLDVKPRNIIMSAPPRLIDLSVAARLDDLDRIVSPVGTDAYMAPEQCDPQLFGRIGPASDVWGLGATLYDATVGSPPFPPGAEGAGAAPEQHFPQLVSEPAPFPKDVPEGLRELVLSCLAKDPEERPSARAVAERLEPWVADLPRARVGLFRPGGRVRSSVFGV